jgi:Arc/MetJ-type ribon-helix-helix transcriptional regulator
MSRQVVAVSMPAGMLKWVRARADGNFGSVSDYIRHLVRDDQGRQRVFACQGRTLEERRERALNSPPRFR